MFQDSRVLGKGKLRMNTRPLVQVRIFPFNLNVFKWYNQDHEGCICKFLWAICYSELTSYLKRTQSSSYPERPNPLLMLFYLSEKEYSFLHSLYSSSSQRIPIFWVSAQKKKISIFDALTRSKSTIAPYSSQCFITLSCHSSHSLFPFDYLSVLSPYHIVNSVRVEIIFHLGVLPQYQQRALGSPR